MPLTGKTIDGFEKTSTGNGSVRATVRLTDGMEKALKATYGPGMKKFYRWNGVQWLFLNAILMRRRRLHLKTEDRLRRSQRQIRCEGEHFVFGGVVLNLEYLKHHFQDAGHLECRKLEQEVFEQCKAQNITARSVVLAKWVRPDP